MDERELLDWIRKLADALADPRLCPRKRQSISIQFTDATERLKQIVKKKEKPAE